MTLRLVLVCSLFGITLVSASTIRFGYGRIETSTGVFEIKANLTCVGANADASDVDTDPLDDPDDPEYSGFDHLRNDRPLRHEPPDSLDPEQSFSQQVCEMEEEYLELQWEINSEEVDIPYSIRTFYASQCLRSFTSDGTVVTDEGFQHTDSTITVTPWEEGVSCTDCSAQSLTFQIGAALHLTDSLPHCMPFCVMIAASFDGGNNYGVFMRSGLLLQDRKECMFPYDASINLPDSYVPPITISPLYEDGQYSLSWEQLIGTAGQSILEAAVSAEESIEYEDDATLSVIYFIRPQHWLDIESSWYMTHGARDIINVAVGDLVLGTVQVARAALAGGRVSVPAVSQEFKIILTGPNAQCFVTDSLCGTDVEFIGVLDFKHETADPDRRNNVVRLLLHVTCPDDMYENVQSKASQMFYNHVTQGHDVMILNCDDEQGYSIHTYDANENVFERRAAYDLSLLEYYGYKRLEMMELEIITNENQCLVETEDEMAFETGSNGREREDMVNCRDDVIRAFRLNNCECDGNDISQCDPAVEMLRDACSSYEPGLLLISWILQSEEDRGEEHEEADGDDWMDMCDPAFQRDLFHGGGDEMLASKTRRAIMFFNFLMQRPEIYGCCDSECENISRENSDERSANCVSEPWAGNDTGVCSARALSIHMHKNPGLHLRMNWDLQRILRHDYRGFGIPSHDMDNDDHYYNGMRDGSEGYSGRYGGNGIYSGMHDGSGWNSGMRDGSGWNSDMRDGSRWNSGMRDGSGWNSGMHDGSRWNSDMRDGSGWNGGMGDGSGWNSGMPRSRHDDDGETFEWFSDRLCGMVDLTRPSIQAPMYYKVEEGEAGEMKIMMTRHNVMEDEDRAYCWRTIAQTTCHCASQWPRNHRRGGQGRAGPRNHRRRGQGRSGPRGSGYYGGSYGSGYYGYGDSWNGGSGYRGSGADNWRSGSQFGSGEPRRDRP